MKLRKYTYILLALAALTVSCGQLGLYTHEKEQVLATVGDHNLMMSDVENIFQAEMTAEDSTKLLDSYIENWIKSQVKIDAATAALSGQEQEIDELVALYRASLITYRFENDIVSRKLDTVVTQEQSKDYYSKNRDNFRLAGPIVKAAVVRIPVKKSNRKMEEMFKKNSDKDWQEFQEICMRNNYKLYDYTNEWADFNTVIGHLPFTNSNFDEFLKSKKYYEVEDDQYHYLMKVLSYSPTGDYSPIEREVDNIRRILLNGRRAELIRNLEDSLLQAAKTENKIVINSTK